MSFSGTDEQITCACGNVFTFTVKDQEFYTRQGFTDKPKRCKPCRDKRKAERANQAGQASAPAPQSDYGAVWQDDRGNRRNGNGNRRRRDDY